MIKNLFLTKLCRRSVRRSSPSTMSACWYSATCPILLLILCLLLILLVCCGQSLLCGRSSSRLPDRRGLPGPEGVRTLVGIYIVKITPNLARYTCEECVEGLEWVEAYIEDPIMIAEYVVYLEQNFCLGENEGMCICWMFDVSLFR